MSSPRRRKSVSQGGSPVRISPGTEKILRRQMKPARSPKRSKTLPEFQSELGKDVPLEVALKRVLVTAQRGDWAGCEQALRAVESHGQSSVSALADLLDPASGNTPLMYAAMENKISLLEKMIWLGSPLHLTNKEGYGVLHLACIYAKPDMVSFILSQEKMSSFIGQAAGKKGQNCLHLTAARVAHQQSVSIGKELLRQGPTQLKLSTDKEGNIPLMTAIDAGNQPLCLELLTGEDVEAQISQTKLPLRDGPLHLAARRRLGGLVKAFIEAGCPTDKVNGEGQTCLHIAASNGDENLLRILWTARADSSISDLQDRTPIYLAAERGHTLVVEFLADKFKSSVFDRAKDGSTLLHVAALHGHSETAMVLHKRGVPLLMPNSEHILRVLRSNGARAIHVAAQKGFVGVIHAIVARGENVNVLTNHGLTPLHLAVEMSNSEVVECLLGHGATVDLPAGKNGITALHLSCRKGDPRSEKCVKMLLKSGANPNFPMVEEGRTALHEAASQPNSARILRLLLENGADVGKVDVNGEMALHAAVKSCNFKAVKALMEILKRYLGNCSTFVGHPNELGETTVHLACAIHKGQLHFPGEDTQILQLLLMNGGADHVLKLGGKSQETPLHYVAQTGNADIMSSLFQRLDSGKTQLLVNMQSSKGWSPLCTASSFGHRDCVDLILQNQGRVDIFDHEGRSPLHLAAEFGSLEICRLLLKAKAFVNSKTKPGWSALHFAAQKGHLELVQDLIKTHGATVDSLTMKKQTPLHLAATAGEIEVCSLLIELGASLDATDDNGQKAIHLAAFADQADVVLMLLKARSSLVSSMTKDGNTCAHIAARKGSLLVMTELMKFDSPSVITARNKTNDATALHIATEGGHKELVKLLVEAGASTLDETKQGHTPVHIAAKNGFASILDDFAKHGVNMRLVSRRSGMTALHMAALFGETDAIRELLTHVPSHLRSELPTSHALIKEFSEEADLTPLHLACYAGSDEAVRTLLNLPSTNLDAVSTPSGYSAIHFACIGGHIGVVGLLLSRSTALLKVEDFQGATCLHVSALKGHLDMVQVLLGQGAFINARDKKGWLALHCAAHAGFLDIVHLLVQTGASTVAESVEGKIPLWYAAAAGNFNVATFLLRQNHDTMKLLEDPPFCHHLMMMGKGEDNKCIEDFVFVSPSPCYTAALLSALFRDSAVKEKDRAADLEAMGDYCEELAKDLVAIAANLGSPGDILNSIDDADINFIDTLIANEQKVAISQYVVQQYLQEIWQGHLRLTTWQFILFFASFVLLPPVWFLFSIPVDKGINRVPVVKFMSYLTSHLYFMAFLTLICVAPPDNTARETMVPFWYEIVVWVWYLGLLLSQITNPGAKGGLSWVKYLLVALGLLSYIAHIVGVFLDPYFYSFVIYVRNMFYGCSLLFAAILILDFLSFHPLFGPWAIIIGELLLDVGKFIVILSLFIAGYALLCTSMNLPFGYADDYPDNSTRTLSQKIDASKVVVQPFHLFELLFFALFGFTGAEDLIISSNLLQSWTLFAFKLVFASYLLLSNVVLVNLLIAMMSDTYQRIQQQSDIEWKYGLAKLIRNMQRTQVAPSPLNLLTTWLVLLHSWCVRGKQERDVARRKFRMAMQEDLITKAPGMKFFVGITDEPKPTPRVIHALGNIKWGFSDGLRPLPVEKVQSKWDLEHERQKREPSDWGASELKVDVPTSKVVSWPKVIRRYLTLQGRERELKPSQEHEADVVSILRQIAKLKNDAVKEDTRPIAGKWSKLVADAVKNN